MGTHEEYWDWTGRQILQIWDKQKNHHQVAEIKASSSRLKKENGKVGITSGGH